MTYDLPKDKPLLYGHSYSIQIQSDAAPIKTFVRTIYTELQKLANGVFNTNLNTNTTEFAKWKFTEITTHKIMALLVYKCRCDVYYSMYVLPFIAFDAMAHFMYVP